MRAHLFSFLLIASLACDGSSNQPVRFDPSLDQLVTSEQWKASNSGRNVFREDGFFAIPEGVERVWIDLGAYKLTVTGEALSRNDDLAIIAIEPMFEHWETWPKNPRLIGVPAAISLERGMLEFNANEADGTNSLLETKPGTRFADNVMRTVEVRSVPSVRLEDVLERIPRDLPIDFLKTDIQGMDLQALKSAGAQLQRVKRVQTEIINSALYEKSGPESMSTEQEFLDYMKSMGFSLVGESPTPNREWLDAFYANDRWDRQVLMKKLGRGNAFAGLAWPGSPPNPDLPRHVPGEKEFEWLPSDDPPPSQSP